MKRVLVLGVVAVIATLTLGASRAGANGVAATIGKELATQGAKAAIAHFAPELEEKIDPTAAGLRAIRDQLAALDSKLSQMQQHQEYLASRQLCATHVGTLRQIVSRARTSLGELIAATNLADATAREQRLDPLWKSRGQLATDQDQLHTTLMDGGISSCGASLQDAMYPFFTSQLAPQVRDWYATYHAAAVALLTIRLNMYRYAGPTGTLKQITKTSADGSSETFQVPVRAVAYTEAEAEALARTVAGQGGWLDQEAALIKPAFPYTESVYLPDKLVFKTRVSFNGLQDGENYRLFQAGWYATIRNAPGCEHLKRIFDQLKVGRGPQVRIALRDRAILEMNSPYIYCEDDSDHIYAYDFDKDRYDDASYIHVYVTQKIGTIMAHDLEGFLNLAPWSYK